MECKGERHPIWRWTLKRLIPEKEIMRRIEVAIAKLRETDNKKKTERCSG